MACRRGDLSQSADSQRAMADYELTAGDYSGWRYWRVTWDGRRLLLVGGQVPWKSWSLGVILVSAMGAALLWVAWRQGPGARSVFTMMCFPVTLAVGGVFLLPLLKARSEASQGAILDYDPERQRLLLPREGLSLSRDQIVEFLILEETPPPRRLFQQSRVRMQPAAELRVRFRNPGLKKATLLRVIGAELLQEVVRALQQAGLNCIRHLKQDPDRTGWKERAL